MPLLDAYKEEARVTEHFLVELLAMFAPTRVIAIGNDAYDLLGGLGQPAICVRHPSYGGQAAFRRGIKDAYL